ncbi:SLOG family protein [Paenibacillus crassostreae]|uniref:Uncharacterized protein n=1 Tax=Paenibacillus crassostreae TaxID=1763538 RepID=A0A167EUZ2_9BACL|nr:SLOG family protein [Paenibacillus crassostreae]AOZ93439.1 hypothetical protein LPB68_15335 [Paenibacillus crassostreae]OAB75906.1 hypothetical protein PNBC_07685 [Paenibacillus crassostreae]
MKNLLVTGYRAHELNIYDQKHKGISYIQKAMVRKLVPLIEDGLEWIITPGQYGVDLWACEVVISLKRQYPHLRCSIITAFVNQEEKWKEDKKEYYNQILRDVDYYAAVSNQPYSGSWQFTARDDLLLRKTEGILLLYDEDSGEGSPKYMKEKALKRQQQEGYVYMNICSEDIQSIADEETYEMD